MSVINKIILISLYILFIFTIYASPIEFEDKKYNPIEIKYYNKYREFQKEESINE